MTPALYWLADLSAGVGEVVDLTGPEAHHAATVKRIAIGERVLLADGSGVLVEAQAVEVARDRVRFEILSRREIAVPQPRFTVVQALPKGDRADLAVEVLTELGADEIVPWSASRSISQWRGAAGGDGAGKAARGVAKWRRTAAEASKQSRRARIPDVAELADTATIGQRVAAADLALVLHEESELPLSGFPIPDKGEVLLIVGPEGGVSPAELESFAMAGGQPVRLGAEVLRTSTAGAAALAVLSVASGRWR